MSNYDHIIWDWNGTIIDDAWLCVEVMNEVLEDKGLPLININTYRENFGFPVKTYYKKLGFNFHDEKFEIVGLEFIKKYLIRRFEPKIYPKFKKIIESLVSNNISHSILSAQDQQTLTETTKYYDVDKYFSNIIGLNNQYAYGKINAGIKLLKKLRYNKNRILIIGDTKHDGEVALKLGVECLLLNCGHNDNSQLNKVPFKIIKSHDEIYSYVID